MNTSQGARDPGDRNGGSYPKKKCYFEDKLQAMERLNIPEGLIPLSRGKGLDRGRGGCICWDPACV